MHSSALSAQGLAYRFPGADDDVISRMSFDAGPGARVGVFGENGSGKTTLLDLCTGVLRPTGGSITLGGVPVQAGGARIARIDADFDMFEYLSLEQNIRFFLRFYRARVSEQALTAMFERYRLADDRALPAVQASRGMRRKTQLITSLLADPVLLVADEPLDGLDEETQGTWLEDLRALSSRGSISVIALHSRALIDRHATLRIHLTRGGPAEVHAALGGDA